MVGEMSRKAKGGGLKELVEGEKEEEGERGEGELEVED